MPLILDAPDDDEGVGDLFGEADQDIRDEEIPQVRAH